MQSQQTVAKTEQPPDKIIAIKPQGSQTRCYLCGNPEIVSLCHHCARPMCGSHTPATEGNNWLWAGEFAELELPRDIKNLGEMSIHCQNCDHRVWSRTFFVSGVAALILGLSLVIPTRDLPSLALVVVLGCALNLGIVGFMRSRKIGLAPVKHPLPLLPTFGPPRVSETLRGKIAPKYPQGPNGSSVRYPSAGGTLTINASFSQADRERMERYRRKFEAQTTGTVNFHAGFAALKGPVHLVWTQTDIKTPVSATVIPLTGQLDQLPYFGDSPESKERDWRISQHYDLPVAAELGDFPLDIVPHLAQEGGQRVLELEVQWAVPHFPGSNLKIDHIQSLVLHIPDNSHEVESAVNIHVIGEDEAQGRKLTWQGISLSAEDLILQRHIFPLRFESTIDPIMPIRGEVKIAFKGSISGIQRVDLFYPLGQKVEGIPSRVETVISAEFELSLERIPLQHVRIVPDPQKDPDRQATITFADIVPDFATVAALTNALDDQGFEVEMVRENPPRPIEGETGTSYHWEIAGSHHLGVLPVAYTLDISGESANPESHQPAQTSTRVRLRISGQYSQSSQKWPVKGKSASPSPEQQIVEVWDALNQLVQNAMQGIKTS
ncbi:MAG: hypothetical protein HY326_00465 [Chloroflexi bacterium]|nr:hypothetical protein [Chloroflexota bacterium]